MRYQAFQFFLVLAILVCLSYSSGEPLSGDDYLNGETTDSINSACVCLKWTEWINLGSPYSAHDVPQTYASLLSYGKAKAAGKVDICAVPVSSDCRVLVKNDPDEIDQSESSHISCPNIQLDTAPSHGEMQIKFLCWDYECPCLEWSKWFNYDGPGDDGDEEILGKTIGREDWPCPQGTRPLDVDCRTAEGLALSETKNKMLQCNLDGFRCLNRLQPKQCTCDDFMVRFLCLSATPESSYHVQDNAKSPPAELSPRVVKCRTNDSNKCDPPTNSDIGEQPAQLDNRNGGNNPKPRLQITKKRTEQKGKGRAFGQRKNPSRNAGHRVDHWNSYNRRPIQNGNNRGNRPAGHRKYPAEYPVNRWNKPFRHPKHSWIAPARQPLHHWNGPTGYHKRRGQRPGLSGHVTLPINFRVSNGAKANVFGEQLPDKAYPKASVYDKYNTTQGSRRKRIGVLDYSARPEMPGDYNLIDFPEIPKYMHEYGKCMIPKRCPHMNLGEMARSHNEAIAQRIRKQEQHFESRIRSAAHKGRAFEGASKNPGRKDDEDTTANFDLDTKKEIEYEDGVNVDNREEDLFDHNGKEIGNVSSLEDEIVPYEGEDGGSVDNLVEDLFDHNGKEIGNVSSLEDEIVPYDGEDGGSVDNLEEDLLDHNGKGTGNVSSLEDKIVPYDGEDGGSVDNLEEDLLDHNGKETGNVSSLEDEIVPYEGEDGASFDNPEDLPDHNGKLTGKNKSENKILKEEDGQLSKHFKEETIPYKGESGGDVDIDTIDSKIGVHESDDIIVHYEGEAGGNVNNQKEGTGESIDNLKKEIAPFGGEAGSDVDSKYDSADSKSEQNQHSKIIYYGGPDNLYLNGAGFDNHEKEIVLYEGEVVSDVENKGKGADSKGSLNHRSHIIYIDGPHSRNLKGLSSGSGNIENQEKEIVPYMGEAGGVLNKKGNDSKNEQNQIVYYYGPDNKYLKGPGSGRDDAYNKEKDIAPYSGRPGYDLEMKDEGADSKDEQNQIIYYYGPDNMYLKGPGSGRDGAYNQEKDIAPYSGKAGYDLDIKDEGIDSKGEQKQNSKIIYYYGPDHMYLKGTGSGNHSSASPRSNENLGYIVMETRRLATTSEASNIGNAKVYDVKSDLYEFTTSPDKDTGDDEMEIHKYIDHVTEALPDKYPNGKVEMDNPAGPDTTEPMDNLETTEHHSYDDTITEIPIKTFDGLNKSDHGRDPVDLKSDATDFEQEKLHSKVNLEDKASGSIVYGSEKNENIQPPEQEPIGELDYGYQSKERLELKAKLREQNENIQPTEQEPIGELDYGYQSKERLELEAKLHKQNENIQPIEQEPIGELDYGYQSKECLELKAKLREQNENIQPIEQEPIGELDYGYQSKERLELKAKQREQNKNIQPTEQEPIGELDYGYQSKERLELKAKLRELANKNSSDTYYSTTSVSYASVPYEILQNASDKMRPVKGTGNDKISEPRRSLEKHVLLPQEKFAKQQSRGFQPHETEFDHSSSSYHRTVLEKNNPDVVPNHRRIEKDHKLLNVREGIGKAEPIEDRLHKQFKNLGLKTGNIAPEFDRLRESKSSHSNNMDMESPIRFEAGSNLNNYGPYLTSKLQGTSIRRKTKKPIHQLEQAHLNANLPSRHWSFSRSPVLQKRKRVKRY